MKTYIKKSPTRVDFTGGTLDCWPLYLMVDQAVTINLCIDILTHAELKVRGDSKIRIDISDLNYQKDFSNLSDFEACKDSELDLIRAHVLYWRPEKGFEVLTKSQSPVGGGLGGSSSLSMGLVEVFSEAFGHPMSDLEKVALSRDVEAQVLKKPTGTQDYFPANLSGLNAIHYIPGSMNVESLPVSLEDIEKSLSLVYTGRPHHSGINNWSVIRNIFDGDKETLKCLAEIKEISEDFYKDVKSGNLSGISEIFQRELSARKRLSGHFTSPEIDRLTDVSLRAGAQAVKICGAGGGGGNCCGRA